MYDPRDSNPSLSGGGDSYVNDGTGNLSVLSSYSSWRKTWSTIVADRFVDSENTSLMFYDNTYDVDVLVVRGADDDGGRLKAVDVGRIDGWIRQLNLTFATAGFQFGRQFDPQLTTIEQLDADDCSVPESICQLDTPPASSLRRLQRTLL